METKPKSKGLSFFPIKEISEEAKEKLKKMMDEREERIKKIVEDYRSGKLILQK